MRIRDGSSDVCSSDLLRDWAEDVELVPDLGQRVGSFTWFRGLATCLGLCAAALYLSPGFHPLPGAPQPLMPARQFDEVRSQMIMPLALGADSGRRKIGRASCRERVWQYV